MLTYLISFKKGEIWHQLIELIILQRLIELQSESQEFSACKEQTRFLSLIPMFLRSNVARETESELNPGAG
jgi:hypothetical protein